MESLKLGLLMEDFRELRIAVCCKYISHLLMLMLKQLATSYFNLARLYSKYMPQSTVGRLLLGSSSGQRTERTKAEGGLRGEKASTN